MPIFSITDDNNITAFDSPEQAAKAADPQGQLFDSQAAFSRIAAEWPLSRFVEIWNSIPGHAEVQRFANRNKAVARIWKAIQPLARNGEPTAAHSVDGNKAPRRASRESRPAQKRAGRKTSAAKHSGRSNKKVAVIAMMKRARGATLAEIVKATGWEAHTVRGFVSILGSKGGHTIHSTRNASGQRTYRLAK